MTTKKIVVLQTSWENNKLDGYTTGNGNNRFFIFNLPLYWCY